MIDPQQTPAVNRKFVSVFWFRFAIFDVAVLEIQPLASVQGILAGDLIELRGTGASPWERCVICGRGVVSGRRSAWRRASGLRDRHGNVGAAAGVGGEGHLHGD